MSARRKTPTADENKKTAIFDSGKHRRKGADSQFPVNVDPTVVDGPLARSLAEEPAMPSAATTVVDPPPSNAAPTVHARPVPPQVQAISRDAPPGPIQVISKKAPTAPFQAISMKTPGGPPAPDAPQPNPPTPILPRPKLRAMTESPQANQQNLGHVAPPYDPEEARARKLREYVIWGCVAVILASAIALVVWFVAR